MADGQGQQYDTSQLDTVQHPVLGPLKFPKDMPYDERNQQIDEMLKAQAHTSPLPVASYQNRPKGPILNANETPTQTFGKRFLGAIGALGEHGEQAPDLAGTFTNIPKNFGRFLKGTAEELKPMAQTESILSPIHVPVGTAALYIPHTIARGIEGLATSAEESGKDIYQGLRHNDPRTLAGGVGETAGTIANIEAGEKVGEVTEATGKAIGKKIAAPSSGKTASGLISRILRDPKTGKVTVSPSTIAERVVPQRPEILAREAAEARNAAYNEKAEALMRRGAEQADLDKLHEQRLEEIEKNRRKELADAERLKEQHARSLVQRGKEQAKADQAHAERLKETETARLEELAANERLKEQHAQALMRRGVEVGEPETGTAIGPKIEGPQTQPMRFSGNEGTAARWSDDTVLDLAAKGNRTAIEQVGRRGLDRKFAGDPRLNNLRYVMGDVDYPRIVYNPREATRFAPEPTSIRNLAHPPKSTGATIEIPPGYGEEPPETLGAIGRPIEPSIPKEATAELPIGVNEPLTPSPGLPEESDIEMDIRRGGIGPARTMAEDIRSAEETRMSEEEMRRNKWEQEQRANRLRKRPFRRLGLE